MSPELIVYDVSLPPCQRHWALRALPLRGLALLPAHDFSPK